MSWTYSMNPGTSPKDTVRYLIGDTNIDNPIVQDEEIQFNLAEVNSEPYRAASNTCYNLAALFTGMAQSESKSVGGLSISKSLGDRAQRYERLAKDLLIRSRRVNPPTGNADPNALGAEFTIPGQFDPYYAHANTWPSTSDLGVSTTYGTGSDPDYGGH
jgi:hypothetical protein